MILGITGRMGSGKDTFADILVRDHGFVKIGLADGIKRFCRDVFDFTEDQMWGPSEMRNAPDMRWMREVVTAQSCSIDGCPHADPTVCEMGTYFEREGLTPRYALQTLGTEWGRAMHPDTWVRYTLRVARAVQAGQKYDQRIGLLPSGGIVGRSVVISDCRFRNEFDAVHAIGGKIVRLRRPGGLADPHPSETEQESIPDHEFDHVYMNSGTLGDLEKDIMEWMRCQNPNV